MPRIIAYPSEYARIPDRQKPEINDVISCSHRQWYQLYRIALRNDIVRGGYQLAFDSRCRWYRHWNKCLLLFICHWSDRSCRCKLRCFLVSCKRWYPRHQAHQHERRADQSAGRWGGHPLSHPAETQYESQDEAGVDGSVNHRLP